MARSIITSGWVFFFFLRVHHLLVWTNHISLLHVESCLWMKNETVDLTKCVKDRFLKLAQQNVWLQMSLSPKQWIGGIDVLSVLILFVLSSFQRTTSTTQDQNRWDGNCKTDLPQCHPCDGVNKQSKEIGRRCLISGWLMIMLSFRRAKINQCLGTVCHCKATPLSLASSTVPTVKINWPSHFGIFLITKKNPQLLAS